MKKQRLFLLPILAFVLAFTVSCNNDDEKQVLEPDALVEGIWIHTFGSVPYNSYSFRVFYKNGTGYEFELDYADGFIPGEEEDMDPFRYVYDKEDNSIIIIDDGGRWVHTILKITSSQLSWIDPDGDIVSFTKYNGNLDDVEREFDVELYVDND